MACFSPTVVQIFNYCMMGVDSLIKVVIQKWLMKVKMVGFYFMYVHMYVVQLQ